MSDETFYLKIETSPEKFEAWLGEVTIPSVYYKKLLPNQKDIMWCSDVQLRKIQSGEAGFIYFLIFSKCNINYFVSDNHPFFETRQEELALGFIKFIAFNENQLFIVGYRQDDKWSEVLEQLFRRLKTEYRPTEPDLKMLDDRSFVLEMIKTEKENSILRAKQTPQNPTEELRGREEIENAPQALTLQQPRKSKRGPHNYSIDEKKAALEEWDNLDKDKDPRTLAEWLVGKFGGETGYPMVALSTFHGWRQQIRRMKNSADT